ncbi:formimidoylglutamase [Taibaiella lutea]|uniref:Formimidoylglutamase n=1 Tax=Taibaiella lutea TaxID=2608001 RepID=A0A5M6CPX0_9BACT|nr:formimidoylglutamase [Taibaiella lutea]KAA5537214.1 formimidoylglutamase [Taibaiella lutea]
MPYLQSFEAQDLQSLISRRTGEIKLGECCLFFQGDDMKNALAAFQGKFVVIGLPEDIGVRANGGIGGTQTAWLPFLKSFVNIQETKQLSGKDFFILGSINFEPLMKDSKDATIEKLRESTARIDDIVTPVIQEIISHNKIPIVIGGGHNNAYPLLKALSSAKGKTINVVNLDAHSDFRQSEGRHSGNGFRYAYQEGYLKKYAMLGLHEAYNGQHIVDELQVNNDLQPLFFEDVFLRNKMTWSDAISTSLSFVKQDSFGVELDVDCIENVLSSAATPVGISTQQALQYLYQCGLNPDASYLHLPEGISQRTDGWQNIFTGKLLNYLVQAFCKGVTERK